MIQVYCGATATYICSCQQTSTVAYELDEICVAETCQESKAVKSVCCQLKILVFNNRLLGCWRECTKRPKGSFLHSVPNPCPLVPSIPAAICQPSPLAGRAENSLTRRAVPLHCLCIWFPALPCLGLGLFQPSHAPHGPWNPEAVKARCERACLSFICRERLNLGGADSILFEP